MPRGAEFRALLLVLVASAPIFLVGLGWGLPSRAADPFLFGGREPWSGRKILDLAGGWQDEPTRGADVARHPLDPRGQVLVVNATDAQRAQILLRYRLYSYQPDEASTLRALSGMRPGRGPYGGMDPRLYQYGGLWIYPVGVMLRVASLLGWVDARTDVAYYLDHPEAFGRFYVVARLWSVTWALVGVATVFLLVRRLSGGWVFPAVAGLLFAMLPVVVNMAHEGKPHLPGAVLMLLAALAGSRYVESGRRRDWILAGVLCGAATGMVLSAYPVFVILPVMALLRSLTWRRRLALIAGAASVGLAVYVLTNPYLALNLIVNRAVIVSNLGTSTAMYHAGAGGLLNAVMLIAEGTSPPLAIAGTVGAVLLGARAVRVRKQSELQEVRRRATGLLLAAPAVWVAAQFVVFATGKPGEYARFALLFDVVLAIEAVVAVATFVRCRVMQVAALCLLLGTAGYFGGLYLMDYVRDSRQPTPRLQWAERLGSWQSDHRPGEAPVLVVHAEPAPYVLPPVDLFSWQIRLVPQGYPPNRMLDEGDVAIRAVDACPSAGIWAACTSTRLSWAAKWFEARTREGGVLCER